LRLLALALAGLVSADAAAAGPELCERAHREGWRASSEGHVFPPWFFEPHTRLEVGATDGLQRLFAALTTRGITPVLVVIPPAPLGLPDAVADLDTDGLDWSLPAATTRYRELVWWLEAQGAVAVPVLDLALDPARTEPFFLPLDHHWTPQGSRAAAQAVADAIRKDPKYASASTRRFEVVEAREIDLPFGGSSGKALHARCKTDLPTVSIPVFKSKALEPPQLGLLDDAPPIPVVVLGSSFSAPKFSFPSFVRAAADLEVLPVDVDGGRMTGAALTYFTSADFRDAPPMWVIWEMAIATEGLPDNGAAPFLWDPDVYRQLVPAVVGACDTPVHQGTAPLAPGTSPVFKAGAGPAVGAGQYLVLDLTDKTPGPLTVVTRFADGTEDRFGYGQYSRIDTPERFFMEFPQYRSSPVASIAIEAGEAASGEVQYRVCAY
jgi:hypothetical protein